MLLVVSRVKAQLSISILGFESSLLTEIFLQVNRHVVVYSAEAREIASPPPDPGVHSCVCVCLWEIPSVIIAIIVIVVRGPLSRVEV